MKLNLNQITFIIVTYRSDKIIHNCLRSLPKESKKIIVENSGNINLEKELKSKYDNIEVILSKNIGMGSANNIGLKRCKTEYAYVLNPDTILNEDTLINLYEGLGKISDFSLASPLNDDPKIPNYKILTSSNNSNILSVDRIDGFSMFFNLKKFSNKLFFDEKFFLYLENDDLCLRIKKKGELIYIIKNSLINHKGGISKNNDLEYLRNWHWMWSKFYFNKKNYGLFFAYFKILPNLFGSIFKFSYYSICSNKYKKNIYWMRLSGIINGILGNNSWLRPKD